MRRLQLVLLVGVVGCEPSTVPNGSGASDGGSCTAKDGECQDTKDSDCAKSEKCSKYGSGTRINGLCGDVTKHSDCEKSEGCVKDGKCTAMDGDCVWY